MEVTFLYILFADVHTATVSLVLQELCALRDITILVDKEFLAIQDANRLIFKKIHNETVKYKSTKTASNYEYLRFTYIIVLFKVNRFSNCIKYAVLNVYVVS